MSEMVLDASALLVLLNAEPGAERVAETVVGATVSAVNYSEVVAKLADAGVPADDIGKALGGLGLRVVPFDAECSFRAGLLRPRTRHLGLSLGDRACLAQAELSGLPVLTADRIWGELETEVVVEILR